jgi:hypothetical protein
MVEDGTSMKTAVAVTYDEAPGYWPCVTVTPHDADVVKELSALVRKLPGAGKVRVRKLRNHTQIETEGLTSKKANYVAMGKAVEPYCKAKGLPYAYSDSMAEE